MAHLETLSEYACARAGAHVQSKLTPADLAWALEVPAIDQLLSWLADVIDKDNRAGETISLEKEEREM